jgi:WD40 repeat protein
MADVFLSYKREDQQVARQVAADLEAEGFSAFFDVRIEVGDSWDATIERELNTARAVVVLWSPKSRESQWVRRESREAMARRILCPAMIARCKVPLEFSDLQAADLIGRRAGDRAHAEWRRLCDGVAKCVGRKARGIEVQAAPVLKSSPIDSISKLSQALPKLPRPAQAESRPEANSAGVASNATSRRALVAGGAAVAGAAVIAGGYYGWTRVRAEGVQRAWEEARAEGTRRAVLEFLNANADSPQAAEARLLLATLPLTIREVAVLHGHTSVHSAAFSPNGLRIISDGDYQDNTARLWDASTSRQIAIVRGMEGATQSTFSPDGTRILTLGGETPCVWDVEDGREIARLRGHTANVSEAAFSPDGSLIVTGGGYDNTARVWDAATGEQMASMRVGNTVQSVAFSPDGEHIATAGGDNAAQLWNATTGAQIAVMQHGNIVYSAMFSVDGARIVTASVDQTARVWDAATAREVAVLRGHEEQLSSAAFSPNGLRILTLSIDGTARLWNAETGQEITILRGRENNVASAEFSPDGARVVVSSYDNTTRVHDSETGRDISTLRGGDLLAFSQDSSRIITRSGDNTARLWDLATGREISTLLGHNNRVNSASFQPLGNRIVTASLDATVRIWEIDEEA